MIIGTRGKFAWCAVDAPPSTVAATPFRAFPNERDILDEADEDLEESSL
jgi:hypothetical protein